MDGGQLRRRPRRGRRTAWALCLALLPSLLFVGHWPDLELTVPFVRHTIVLDSTPEDAAGSHDHSSHCHADVTGCTDQPITGVSAFALIQEWAEMIGAGALLMLLPVAAWRPTNSRSVDPQLQPPRFAIA